jgi:hypothetical protein
MSVFACERTRLVQRGRALRDQPRPEAAHAAAAADRLHAAQHRELVLLRPLRREHIRLVDDEVSGERLTW